MQGGYFEHASCPLPTIILRPEAQGRLLGEATARNFAQTTAVLRAQPRSLQDSSEGRGVQHEKLQRPHVEAAEYADRAAALLHFLAELFSGPTGQFAGGPAHPHHMTSVASAALTLEWQS